MPRSMVSEQLCTAFCFVRCVALREAVVMVANKLLLSLLGIPAGSFACVVCAAGTSQAQTGQTSCVPCTPGHYQLTVGATQCAPCGVGTAVNGRFSVLASAPCRSLDASKLTLLFLLVTIRLATGASVCPDCLPGYSAAITGTLRGARRINWAAVLLCSCSR
jgi:hypothetical protein